MERPEEDLGLTAGSGPSAAQSQRHLSITGLLAALRVIAALAILDWLVGLVGLKGVLERIGTCSPAFTLAAFAAALVSQWLAALRLELFAKSQEFALSRMEALAIGLAVVFYGLFVPGGSVTGWAVRLLRFSPRTSRMGAALLLLAGDRALATATGASIGVMAGLAMSGSSSPWILGLLLTIAASASLLCLATFTFSADNSRAWARRVPVLSRFVASPMAQGSFQKRPRPATVILAIALSFAAHVVGVLSWLILAYALGVNLDPFAVAWIRSAAMVVTLLPATAGGLGLRDGAVVYLMSRIGVAAADALAFSLLVFTATVLAVGIVGGLFEAHSLLKRHASGAR